MKETTTQFTGAANAPTISIIIQRSIFALFFATQLLLVNMVAQAQPYQIINTQNSVVGGDLSKTVTTIQEGNNSLDRFLMTEVSKPLPDQAIRGVVLLMPLAAAKAAQVRVFALLLQIQQPDVAFTRVG